MKYIKTAFWEDAGSEKGWKIKYVNEHLANLRRTMMMMRMMMMMTTTMMMMMMMIAADKKVILREPIRGVQGELILSA